MVIDNRFQHTCSSRRIRKEARLICNARHIDAFHDGVQGLGGSPLSLGDDDVARTVRNGTKAVVRHASEIQRVRHFCRFAYISTHQRRGPYRVPGQTRVLHTTPAQSHVDGSQPMRAVAEDASKDP
jgi:hypothetical protein